MKTLIYAVALTLCVAFQASAAEKENAVLKTNFGEIEVAFFDDVAPKHVANFKELVSSGFYTGTYFHRVIPGFMVQGGDPNTKDADRGNDGSGNSGKTLPAEFSKIKHERGILSMARRNDPDSASCQFFIMVDSAPHLDNQYTVFGKVVRGMDVVDRIVDLPRDNRDNPLKPVIILNASLVPAK